MTDAPTLTPEQADLIYGMLTQRLYLREDDPERELVAAARDAIWPSTTAYAETAEAIRTLRGE